MNNTGLHHSSIFSQPMTMIRSIFKCEALDLIMLAQYDIIILCDIASWNVRQATHHNFDTSNHRMDDAIRLSDSASETDRNWAVSGKAQIIL